MSESPEASSGLSRVRRALLGKPRDLADRSIFHQLSLIPFLAWVGLGADGLSSSAYGPAEAFTTLGEHRWLAVAMAVMTAATVFIISFAYTRIIAAFPNGGGGYVVATKLLGPVPGLVSGSALLVDYILTVTVSLAAAGDALFSFLPPEWHGAKLGCEVGLVLGMTLLNLRGVREAILPLVPVFLLFLVSHIVLITAGLFFHNQGAPLSQQVREGWQQSHASLGTLGVVLLFARAWSLGGGTYTGIEAVSNGLPILREPRAKTARRTMAYMALSLAATAAGLLVAYLLAGIQPVEGQTLNAVLAERVTSHWPGGHTFSIVTLVSEGALLIVGAQAGFLDGPRVLANMALDGWAPRRFAALSERLTTQNGIALIGISSLAALLYTRGDIGALVVMYSINVFLTFSLSMLGMLKKSLHDRHLGDFVLFLVGFGLCAAILCVTASEKFLEGGWVTLLVTAALVGVFVAIRNHYHHVQAHLAELDKYVPPMEPLAAEPKPLHPMSATAVLLVGGYNGIGYETLTTALQAFPNHYKNAVFVAVGSVDSAALKDEHELARVKEGVDQTLSRYVALAETLGLRSKGLSAIGTDVVAELERLCLHAADECQDVTFFAGQLMFGREQWWHGVLHNQTAFALQKRLQWDGFTMVILPVRIH